MMKSCPQRVDSAAPGVAEQGIKACASGYNLAVKLHLAYLMHLLGGTLTDTLRRLNTHLVVPCCSGSKYASAGKCGPQP